MNVYVAAGYGCGNLGDEAIFSGMRNFFATDSLTQLYINFPSSIPFLQMHSVIENGFPDEQIDKLIIGGGAIIREEYVIQDFIKLAQRAEERNISVEIRGCGAEYAIPECFEATKTLCSYASYIGVRSQKSKEILEFLDISVNEIQHDFAYYMTPDPKGAASIFPKFINTNPIIGIVIGSTKFLDICSQIVKEITCQDYNVVIIPHVRHFVDKDNNEVALGEMLWSNINLYEHNRIEKVKLLPMPSSSEILLGIYSLVHGIIGSRYHSFLMADITQKPLLGLVHCNKTQAFFDEHPYYDFIDVNNTDLASLEKVINFMERIDRDDKGI